MNEDGEIIHMNHVGEIIHKDLAGEDSSHETC